MNLSSNVHFYRSAKEIALWILLIFSLVILNFSDLLGQNIQNTKNLLASLDKSNQVQDATKKDDEKIGGSTLPQLTDIAQFRNPALTFIGATKINKLGILTLGLYTGSNNRDTLSFNSVIAPEICRYGAYFDAITPILKKIKFIKNNSIKDKLWLRTTVNFHEKNTYNLTTQKDFTFSRLQTRFGFEFIFIKDIICIYGNYNWIRPVLNAELYKNNFNLKTKDHTYWDYGVKLFFSKNTISETLGLFIDFNFTYLNESFAQFNPQNDSSKSLIKLGLQQNFR